MNSTLAARPYSDKDYPTVLKWLTAQEWPPLPVEVLPKTGFIVDDYCAGFLYKTDSAIAWLEWVVANPDTDYNKRGEALDNLINSLVTEAKDQGFKIVLTSCQHNRLINRYDNHGFKITDKNMTNLMRVL